MSTGQQFCSFYLDELFFGVEVERVQEVIRHQDTTRVPLAQAVVGGLINLRGQIVTAVNLRHRLGLAEKLGDRQSMNVVIRTEEGAVSLLVDEIGDVVEVQESDFEEPPNTLSAESAELIRGAYKLKDRLLLLLDTEKAVRFS